MTSASLRAKRAAYFRFRRLKRCKSLGLRGVLGTAAILCLCSGSSLNGQVPVSPGSPLGSAAGLARGDQLPLTTLSYTVSGNTKTINIGTDALPDQAHFSRVAIYPGQSLQIHLAFPASYGGQIIFAEVAADDGGSITNAGPAVQVPAGVSSLPAGGFLIGNDGKVVLQYQAPAQAGRYNVQFRFGPLTPVLPFTVMDSAQQSRTLNCPKAN